MPIALMPDRSMRVVQSPMEGFSIARLCASRLSPRVSELERKQVGADSRDTAKVQRLGVQIAARFGLRLQSKVLSAYRASKPFDVLIEESFRGLLPQLVDAMIVSHLLGGIRAAKNATAAASEMFARTVYTRMLDMLTRKAAMKPAAFSALKDAYEVEVFQVIKDATNHVEQKIGKAVLKAAEKGVHVREGVKGLKEAFEAAGFTPRNSFTAEAIFRTQTRMAYSAGRYQQQQDPVIQEILWGYKYVTVGDDRVRLEHAGLEGATLPKNDPFWDTNMPPNGWACRCDPLEIFEEREQFRPPEEIEIEGKMVRPGPDKGFEFNPGKRIAGGGAVPVKPLPTPKAKRR